MTRQFILASAALVVSIGQSLAFNIQFDYSLDASGFFNEGSAQRDRLQDAAAFFAGVIADDLTDITPGGANSWTANFANPGFDLANFDPLDFSNPNNSPAGATLDLTVQADTIIVYVGSQNLTGSTLGMAAPGGFTILGSDPAWTSNISQRGESGQTTGGSATDFAPWGGSLSIDNSTNWNLSLSGDAITTGEFHLYSVILHELGHVLGIGSADSWSGAAHLTDGLSPTVYGTETIQTAGAAMDPTLAAGEVKLFTDVDVAALEAVGWEIAPLPVPEPSASLLALFAGLGLAFRRRR